jgi:hypothetical protein
MRQLRAGLAASSRVHSVIMPVSARARTGLVVVHACLAAHHRFSSNISKLRIIPAAAAACWPEFGWTEPRQDLAEPNSPRLLRAKAAETVA